MTYTDKGTHRLGEQTFDQQDDGIVILLDETPPKVSAEPTEMVRAS